MIPALPENWTTLALAVAILVMGAWIAGWVGDPSPLPGD